MTTVAEEKQSNRIYFSIIQGTFRHEVDEGVEGAVQRDWEAGGNSGTKWEKVYGILAGKITGVSFFEGESGGRKFINLNIVMEEMENGKQPIISIGVGTRYAQDIMKKLPNVDLTEEVRFRPYAFVPEGEDKQVTGVEVMQRGVVTGNFDKKINSFFHKKENGKWVAVNGFPVPEGDTKDYTTEDWSVFYLQTKKFLVQYINENMVATFAGERKVKEENRKVEYPEEEISSENIPF